LAEVQQSVVILVQNLGAVKSYLVSDGPTGKVSRVLKRGRLVKTLKWTSRKTRTCHPEARFWPKDLPGYFRLDWLVLALWPGFV